MSICTWTGDGNSGATIGHGLGKIPSMILVKRRSTDLGWTVYHEALGTGKEVYLNMDQVETSSNFWLTSPTTSVFSVSSSDYINASGETYVGYVFANLEGACKAGSYSGSGSTSGTAGPYVYLGFRPAWVMLKRTDSSGSWWILDSARDPFNEALRGLKANGSDAETGYSGNFLDFYSNGFAVRTSGIQVNASGGTYIYYAVAEAPAKFSNAR